MEKATVYSEGHTVGTEFRWTLVLEEGGSRDTAGGRKQNCSSELVTVPFTVLLNKASG